MAITKNHRHLIVMSLTALLLSLFYMGRPELSSSHRIWRATGDVSFVLLFLTLLVGPLSKIWNKAIAALTWRRQLGIWFAIAALLHTLLIFDGWLNWSVDKFLGYEYVAQLNQVVLLQPGFGLANLLGLVALVFTILLLATSSDKALRYFGGSSWKHLQNFAYLIFYLGSLHAIYFVFFHFNQAMYLGRSISNWIKYYLLMLVITLILVQTVAFCKTFKKRKGVLL